jgi:hypothetical protein
MKDQIKVKVLKLPSRPDIKRQLPKIDKSSFSQIYRHELTKREEIKQESYIQAPQISREEVTQMAQAAAEKIQGVLGSFGASFLGTA